MIQIPESILNEIRYYDQNFRHPSMPRLTPSGVYSLFPKKANDSAETPYQWPDPWPYADKPGVYCIFGLDMELLYVGKASMNNNVGYRLGSYFKYTEDGTKRCHIIHSGWSSKPGFVAIIPVDNDTSFEAAALEEYLIKKLRPTENIRGTRFHDIAT